MDKKEIIRRLKEHIKLVLIMTTILVSGLVFLIGIYIPSKEIYGRQYIVIEDTMRSGMADDVWGNETFAKSSWNSEIYLRFNLADKPNHAEKVEISLYIYQAQGRASMMLFESNWTEYMTSKELLSCFTNDAVMWHIDREDLPRLNATIGIQRIDITDFIKNNDTISLRLRSREPGDDTIFIYTKEADVERIWLPQLIWS